MRRLLTSLAAAAALLVVPTALAAPGLLVGVNDDTPKWKDDPALAAAAADLGIAAYRITIGWNGAQSTLDDESRTTIARSLANIHGKRMLLSVFGKPDAAPRTDAARAAYCAYVGDILRAFPAIRTIGIWNEVNKASFWRPQFEGAASVAPADYVKLLAACATLRAQFPDVVLVSSLSPRGNDNPSARSNISHSPTRFVKGMGDAARAMALQVRLFDHFGQNVYGSLSTDRPHRSHPNNTDIQQGDYEKLMNALRQAFGGTAQPVPGTQGVTVWYLETGFQTTVPNDKRPLYQGAENDMGALEPLRAGTDPGRSDVTSKAWDQATQLGDAIRLAYCQPAVGAFFNFMLADETSLAGWQSGILWADGTAKPSYAAVKAAIADAAAGTVDCAAQTVKAGNASPKSKGKRKRSRG